MSVDESHESPWRSSGALAIVLPAGVTLYLGFTGGGFFVGAPAVAAAALLVVLAVVCTLARDPFAGLGLSVAIVAGSLGLLAVWILISAMWSDSVARALIEFDRALLYGVAVVLGAAFVRSDARIKLALRWFVVAVTVVCAAGLASRLAPEVVPAAPNLVNDRLSFPLTYWNAMGLLAGLGVIFALHLSCCDREPPAVRVAASGALPVLTTALYLTLSRGSIAVTVVAALLYLILARPRGLVAGLIAAVPTCALAVSYTYEAESLLKADHATRPAAVAEGHEVALIVAAAVLLGGLLRIAGLVLDRRLARVDIGRFGSRRARVAVVAAGAGAIIVAALALGAPGWVGERYEGFLQGSTLDSGEPTRARLGDLGNNGRLDFWRVAIDGFQSEPVRGEGAGTYALRWARARPTSLKAEDGHSLYLETASELGIVGLLLVVVALGGTLIAFAVRARGAHRATYSALLAAGLAWAVHAGIDWDWEMPVVSVWLWAFSGMTLAASTPTEWRALGRRLPRVVIALGCLAVAVTPLLMAVSQGRLNDSVEAFKRGDCERTIDSALASAATMPSRPQPFELLSYCDARLGLDRLAIRSMRSAIQRDPRNWELHYGLALVLANAGRDPRAAAERALRLNPREPLARRAVRLFKTNRRSEWRRRAREARLLIL